MSGDGASFCEGLRLGEKVWGRAEGGKRFRFWAVDGEIGDGT